MERFCHRTAVPVFEPTTICVTPIKKTDNETSDLWSLKNLKIRMHFEK